MMSLPSRLLLRPPREALPIRDCMQEVFRLAWALAERDLRARYAQSALGILWNLAQPLAMAWGLFWVGRTLNRPYAPEVWMAAWVVWNAFSVSWVSGALSFAHNRELVTKTALPPRSYPLSKVLVAGVDGAVGLILAGVLGALGTAFGGFGGTNWAFWGTTVLALSGSLLAGWAWGSLWALPVARYKDLAVGLPFLAQLAFLCSPLLGNLLHGSAAGSFVPGWSAVGVVLRSGITDADVWAWIGAVFLLGIGQWILRRWGRNAADWA